MFEMCSLARRGWLHIHIRMLRRRGIPKRVNLKLPSTFPGHISWRRQVCAESGDCKNMQQVFWKKEEREGGPHSVPVIPPVLRYFYIEPNCLASELL